MRFRRSASLTASRSQMANEQYYEKVAGDESSDPLVGEERASRVTRAPPTAGNKRRSVLTKIAILAVAATCFIALVGIISSAVVQYRLPAALEKAQANDDTTAGMGMSDGMTGGMTGGMDGDKAASKMMGDHDDEENPNHVDKPVNPNDKYLSVFEEKHQTMRECGGTPDEARAAGCVYDVMMQLWTPPECMDFALTEKYLAKGNWTWWADVDETHSYSDEQIAKGEHDVVVVAQSYHRLHCIFAWERIVRALNNRAPIIQELISYDHVMHCRHKTLTLPEEGAPAVRGVIAPTGYTRCASYDVWIKNLPNNRISSEL